MDAPTTLPKNDVVRILIVDDDQNCVLGLQRLLQPQEQVQTFGCTDPAKAVAEIEAIAPDVVLLDWHMGSISGEEILQSLQQRVGREEAPPVIVMTGDVSTETRSRALEAGAADFLTKPLDETEVVLRIRNHVRLWRLHRHVQSEKDRLEAVVHDRTAKLRETIAELKEVQQQVIAEERMRALAVMAGGVAHDFNNALMVIRGYSELYARKELGDATPEEMRRTFEIIALAADDAGEIVRRLREFYRPFSGKSEERQRVDLNKIIRESLELAEPKWKTQCQAGGVCVTVETELVPLPEVPVVPAEIREILLNLTFNAVDAMPQGGRIVVRTRATEESVLLEIEDTGTGMTEETRVRCLEPFYTTKGERGTGLGLAITYGIVQRHGGTIQLRSEVNHGTCFQISLPLRKDEEMTPDNILVLPVMHHLRVLVVDDDPSVCAILSRYLQEDEHSVTVAASGCEALEKFTTSEFDLVITDRVMPKMSGDQLAAAIREMKPAEPIILMTGYEGRAVPETVNLLVSKPATMGSIRDAISRVMLGEDTLPSLVSEAESLQLSA